LLFANVRGKRVGEQVSRGIVVQRIGSRTTVRAVATDLTPIVDLRAAWPVTVEVRVVTVLSEVTIPQRNAS
jgi:hypothetical protein